MRRRTALLSQWRVWATSLAALALTTVALFAVRSRLDKAHVALVYLLVVLGGSAGGGRAMGIALSCVAFLAFNFLFLPPYYTLAITDPLDWLVLFTFLVTGVVAAELLSRAQRETRAARARAAEVDRLASLGAETLSAARADEALAAIARVIRSTLGVEECDVYLWDSDSQALRAATPDSAPPALLVRWSLVQGRGVTQRSDGTSHVGDYVDALAQGADVRAVLMPLFVRDRVVGVLRLGDTRGIALDPTRRRYLDALAYYAALGVERMRLAAEAEQAEALREADRLKDSLLATVSHDLRTPLTSIRGIAQAIARDGDDRAHVIEEEVERLNRSVAGLLDLSRISAGGMPLTIALNTAEDLIGAALQRVDGIATGREIVAHLDTSEPVLIGRFDFAQALRILTNLLENALKYAPGATPVELTARRDAEVLAFTVSDRGPGVPAAEVTRIFEPFYRPAGAPADVGGAGLGLAIGRALAEVQGGTLTYAARDGGGSVFTLRLPAADLSEATLDLDDELPNTAGGETFTKS